MKIIVCKDYAEMSAKAADIVAAQVTLKPGCSIGEHPHHGETETYYLLSGKGEYTDNGVARPVEAGEITFCEDGNTHGLKNTGEEDLVFMALIING